MKNKESVVNFKQARGFITVSTTVDPEAHKLAKENKVSWARALDLGLRLIFHEIDPKTHPAPDCSLTQKLEDLQKKRG